MAQPGQMRDARCAFTLIELLAVIAVIGLMSSLLYSAVHLARQKACATRCRGNLRQLALAALAYAAEHDGQFPYAQRREGGTLYGWDFTTTVSWGDGGREVSVKPGGLWDSYNVSGKVMQCPSYLASGTPDDREPYTGYNYNTSYIGHGPGEAHVEPARTSEIKNAMRCALFGDGQYDGGPNKYMRAPFGDIEGGGDSPGFPGRSAGTQGFRHRGRTNVAFCDGHVESFGIPYRPGGKGEVSPGCGFISPDNSLYDWQ